MVAALSFANELFRTPAPARPGFEKNIFFKMREKIMNLDCIFPKAVVYFYLKIIANSFFGENR